MRVDGENNQKLIDLKANKLLRATSAIILKYEQTEQIYSKIEFNIILEKLHLISQLNIIRVKF